MTAHGALDAKIWTLRAEYQQTRAGTLGIDHVAEVVVTAKGDYIYSCYCGFTTMGDLNERSGSYSDIRCYGCEVALAKSDFSGTGTRIYALKRVWGEQGRMQERQGDLP